MLKKTFLLGLLFIFTVASSWAQYTLNGFVVDKNNNPLSDITVHVEKTPIAVYTDVNGFFEIKDIPEGEHTLRIGGVNYEVIYHTFSGSQNGLHFVLKNTLVNLEQVVITGTGTYHRLKNSPVAVEVFTKREIERSGMTDFNSFLSFGNASFNTSSSAIGSSITFNGLRNRHVLILVDGQRLYGDMMGDTDLSRIDMSTVKQVEILKGAASSLYGSDAMGGVINIITERAKAPLTASFFSQYGAYGQLTYRGNIGWNVGKLTSQTSFTRTESDGWQLSDQERIIRKDKKGNITKDVLVPTHKLASGKFSISSLNQQFRFNATKKLLLTAKLNLYRKDNPRPYANYDYDFLYSGSTYGVGARYIFKRGAYVTADFYNDNYDYSRRYNKEVADKKTKKVVHKYGEEILAKRQHYYNGNVKGVFSLGKYNKLTTGLDYTREKLINDESLPEPKDMNTVSMYAQDELNLNDLFQMVGGLRLVHHETFGYKLLPKLSFMYKPLEVLNLRASYAEGFRSPNLMELYYEKETSKGISSGNEDLDPETSRYYSLNAEYVTKTTTISATVYQNDIKNLIDRTLVPLTEKDKELGINQRLQYVNTETARIRGVEFSLNSYLGAGFSLGGSYAFTDAKNLQTDMPLPKSYRHGVTANINWTKDWTNRKLNLNLVGTYQSEREEVSDHGNAPAYQLWNFVTRYTIYSSKGRLSIEPGVTVDNLFDYKDSRPFGAHYNTLSPGRTVNVSVLVCFK